MSEPTAPPAEHLARGIVLIVLAFLCLALISAFAKAASPGVSSGMLVFFQYAISLVILSPWFLRGGVANLRTQHLGLELVWAIFGLGSQFLLFVAWNLDTPLLDAVLLANASPLFIPLVAWVWQKARPDGGLWVSLLVGFVRIVLILQPGAGIVGAGTPIALAAGICSAIGLSAAGLLQLADPAERTLFWYFALSSVLAIPLLVTSWTPPPPEAWLLLLGIGVSMALAQVLTVLAYKQASPSRLAPFNYSVVVFSALIGWIVWSEVPNALTILGVLLVAAGGILSTQRHRTLHPHLPFHRPWGAHRQASE
jgi:drug/metabolite transporter (DMT)-like permease